ncbi:S-protein secretion component I [Vibrio sp. V17_P4S1T151]|nr:prepilin-type N-terminal cleavage/methylation domain-containing protein [Vibrio sp. V25_P4S6T154]OXX47695.1 S-protein secretion component I [Vibrio sp. V17_P4S1T151]OXX61416.1 S-protein secretion component I [Vibrio sp. V15_P4S5T153]OXX67050.1 S-protein secretion component I [Vibrio sp. V20_P4S3T152]
MEPLKLFSVKSMSRSHFGFTLIEVLVALAILVAGFSVIFQMFQQSGITANRINQTQHRVDVEQSIFMSLSHINPSQEQQGVGVQGQVTFQWQATPISPLLNVRSEDGTNPNYVQIYQINIRYQEVNKESQFEFEHMGWKKGVSR